MAIVSLEYSEFVGEVKEWKLRKVEFGQINLLVGKNSTGKTRVLNVIFSLCRILCGQSAGPFASGVFKAEIRLEDQLYAYAISFKDSQVQSESLKVNGDLRLTRNEQGEGKVYYTSEKKFIPFSVPQNVIAIQNKSDRLQHPYIYALNQWASNPVIYHFGSDFGKSRLMQMPSVELTASTGQESNTDVNNIIKTYIDGWQEFGERLDQAIIQDMGLLGYVLKEVAAESLDGKGLGLPVNNLLSLITVEKDLGYRNPQVTMSQGMFRALALIIHLNIAIFSNRRRIILIDDIGEGLDYERASNIINLIIAKASNAGVQVLMTSNDRFVMNEVPLEYWVVLERKKKVVTAFTAKNSGKEFENFKFMGLSNFEFFKNSYFHKAK